jgi:hypothetical protein
VEWLNQSFSDAEQTPPAQIDLSKIGRDESYTQNCTPLINLIGMDDPQNMQKRQDNFDQFVARGGGPMRVGNDYLVRKGYRRMKVDKFVEMMDLSKAQELLKAKCDIQVDLPSSDGQSRINAFARS